MSVNWPSNYRWSYEGGLHHLWIKDSIGFEHHKGAYGTQLTPEGYLNVQLELLNERMGDVSKERDLFNAEKLIFLRPTALSELKILNPGLQVKNFAQGWNDVKAKSN